ncbi:VOC family protein [Leptospirillum ferriphilum]|uniref:Glyoxalase-like domain protein n=1 Tax=Leptospirillum ferriphilum TaxID=178606 RepID=A0A2I2MFW9_9BACT|nr:VOC family protein [Leptospirillum ferriphilum]
MQGKAFKKVAFSCYPVSDMEKARDFYEGVLGLAPASKLHDQWYEYDLGETTFAITTMAAEGFPKPGSQGSVAFEVADIENLVERLRKENVEFLVPDVCDFPTCKAAFLKDPDGNMLSLHQLK